MQGISDNTRYLYGGSNQRCIRSRTHLIQKVQNKKKKWYVINKNIRYARVAMLIKSLRVINYTPNSKQIIDMPTVESG